jgi:hypothetical protein
MSENTQEFIMNIEQLQEEWDNDTHIDDNHLDREAIRTSQLHGKYLKHLIQSKLKLAKMRADYNTLRQAKFRYYRGEMPRDELTERNWDQWQGTKPLKNEMDEFLTGDSDLNMSNIKIEYIATMVFMLESILGQVKSRDWQIRSAVDFKKFISGG